MLWLNQRTTNKCPSFYFQFNPRASIGCSAEPLTHQIHYTLLSYFHCLFTSIYRTNWQAQLCNIVHIYGLPNFSSEAPQRHINCSVYMLFATHDNDFPFRSFFRVVYLSHSCFFFVICEGAKCCVHEKKTQYHQHYQSTHSNNIVEPNKPPQRISRSARTCQTIAIAVVNPKPLSRFSF